MNNGPNKIQLNVQYLWHMIEKYKSSPIINIEYMDKIIKVHEFILCNHFNSYEILKKDIVECENIKKIVLSSSIIIDTYHLEYKYLELIIKYFYGFYYDFKNISLNDLYKIHAFLKKHCMDDSPLMSDIEKKIHHTLYYLPNIDITGGLNSFENHKIYINILCSNKMTKNVTNKYYHYHLFNRCSYDLTLKQDIACNVIENLNELFDKYEKYLIDEEIYDYVLLHVFQKYNLNNDKHTFELKNTQFSINKNDTEEEIKKKLLYYNLMKHKYYTLSFLNKKFKEITMEKLFNGECQDYIDREHLHTIHVIFKCGELERNNKSKNIMEM